MPVPSPMPHGSRHRAPPGAGRGAGGGRTCRWAHAGGDSFEDPWRVSLLGGTLDYGEGCGHAIYDAHLGLKFCFHFLGYRMHSEPLAHHIPRKAKRRLQGFIGV